MKRRWRRMYFPLWERLEMALMWAAPVMLVAGLVLWPLTSVRVAAIGAGCLGLSIFTIFVALRWLPAQGARRWLTYAGGALFGCGMAVGLSSLLATPNTPDIAWLGFANVLAMLVLSLDLAGTTPWYPSTINTTKNHFSLELDAGKCTGAADCVRVCPRDVLKMKGKARKVEIAQPDACLRCGACVVQCPDVALHFRFDDGRLVPAEQIRRMRMNMLGRRSVEAS